MAIPVSEHFPGASCRGLRALTLVAIALGTTGCSINLSSLSPPSEPEKQETPQVTSSNNIGSLTEAIKSNPNDPQAYNSRGSVLAQAGKTAEALADFNQAISLDSNFGQAFAGWSTARPTGSIWRWTTTIVPSPSTPVMLPPISAGA
jgi:hypothetical protein